MSVNFRDWVEIVDAADLSEDSHGNPVPDWGNAPSVREPAVVNPLTTSEDVIGQDTVTSRWRITLLPMTTATSSSRILWRGDTYEVDGEVQLCMDTRARPHHSIALLVRWTG